MGNSSSRRVTVVNDDTIGVVQISESVVQRLKGDSGHSNQKSQQHRRRIAEETSQIEPEILQQVEEPTVVKESKPMHSQESAADAYSTALEQRKKFNEEFRRAEQGWEKKTSELKKQNKVLLETAENKLSSELSRVEEEHMKRTLSPVCPENQEAVEKCYKNNLKSPLNCAKCVRDYMNCLEVTRLKIISSAS